MIDGHFTYAFTVGLLATVNPCGFAMLPAYLSFFLGLDGRTPQGAVDRSAAMFRALVVGASVSAGFLLVFGVLGTLAKVGIDSFIGWVQWATVGIGLGLVALGVALLAGWHLPFSTPRLDKGGRSRSVGSVFLFGVSYAVASIGCAWPLFLGAVVNAVGREGWASGLATFVAYSAGMALVLTALTVALAFARQSVVQGLRRVMPYVDRAAAIMLIVAGAYLAYYWAYVKTTDYGTGAGSQPIERVTGWSSRLENQILEWGPTKVGVALGAVVAVAVAAALVRRYRHDADGGWIRERLSP